MSEELLASDQTEFAFFGLDKIDRTAPRYHCTSAVFRKLRPEVHRIAVELLGAGRHGVRELCRLLHCSHHTLQSIEHEQAETLATLRKKAAQENLQLHRMALERAAELIPRCTDLAKVAISSGIFAEKSQLFAGEATARLEVQPANLVERFEAYCSDLEKRVQGRVIDVVSKEKNQVAALPGAEIAGRPDRELQDSDSKSHGPGDFTQGEQTDTDNYPDETDPGRASPSLVAPAAAARAQGGGGGEPADAGRHPKSISA